MEALVAQFSFSFLFAFPPLCRQLLRALPMQALLIAWPVVSCLYLLPSKRNDPDLFAWVLGTVGFHLLLVLVLQSLGAVRAVRSYEAGKIEWARRKREKEKEKLDKKKKKMIRENKDAAMINNNNNNNKNSVADDDDRQKKVEKEREKTKSPTPGSPQQGNQRQKQKEEEEGLELATLASTGAMDETIEKGKETGDKLLEELQATSSETQFADSDLEASESGGQTKKNMGKSATLAVKAAEKNVERMKKLLNERQVDWWSFGNWMTILSLLYETLQLASLPMAELAEVRKNCQPGW